MTQSGQGFLITKAEPGVVVVSPGESVTLFCAVDDHYEWCKWFHPGGQFCDFEWKRNEDNITMQHSVEKWPNPIKTTPPLEVFFEALL